MASIAVWGCAQVIGADGDRELAPAGVLDGDAEAPEDDGGGLPVPTDGCPPDQKKCNGACVPKSIEYGCGSSDCAPCSVPNAATVVCKEGQCAAGTCKPGFGACGEAKDGCQADLTSPLTCTGCLTSCNVDAGQVCAPAGCGADCGALSNCSGACVDTKVNVSNCGKCGTKCAGAANGDPECKSGACVVTCRQGFAHCDGNPMGPCAALQIFYQDVDGDGFGVVGTTKAACDAAAAGPGWSAKAGDCHDGNAQVFPGQAAFFGTPYTAPGGAPSYDYNCDGAETENGAISHFSSCTAACFQEGVARANSGRVGAGVNDFCGSTRYTTCQEYSSSSGPLPLLPMDLSPLAISCRAYNSTIPANPCR